ncbi:hypothetical protein KAI65_02870 [Candidatus Parcubacteria bacterium]|nr:hypothetical protein [Candidatus Parcubacteria bacterium]
MQFVDIKNFCLNNKNYIILVLIIILGFYFRFKGLISQGGLILGDEEVYIGIARSVRGSIIFLYDFIVNGFDLSDIREKAMDFFSGGFRISTIQRPGYIFLITIPIIFFGAYDFIPLFINAALSTASIYLIFLVAKEITKREDIGLISALLFSLSGYAIFWSRSGLAQTTTAFLFILGILFYLFSLRNDEFLRNSYFLKISALTFGFLFTTHYSIFIFLILIFCFDFFYFFKKKKFYRRAKNMIIFFLSPVLFFQLISLFYSFVLNNLGYKSGSISYFSEIIHVLKSMPNFISAYAHSHSFWRYFEYIIAHDSIIIVVLMILFIPIFIYKKWHRNIRYLFLALIFFLPFIFYSSMKLKTEYNFVVFLPLLAIICGISFCSIMDFIKNIKIKKTVFSLLLIVILFFGIKSSIIFSGFTNHYADVAKYLKKQGNISALCGTRNGVENTKFYLNDFSIKSADNDCEGAQYAILDWQMAYFPYIHNQYDYIVKENESVLVFEQQYSDYMCPRLRWEDDISRCKDDSLLRVYRLK